MARSLVATRPRLSIHVVYNDRVKCIALRLFNLNNACLPASCSIKVLDLTAICMLSRQSASSTNMKAHIPGTSEHKLAKQEKEVHKDAKDAQKSENKLNKLEAKQELKDEKKLHKEEDKLAKQHDKAAAAAQKVNMR